jgi:CRISPR-associated protein Cas6
MLHVSLFGCLSGEEDMPLLDLAFPLCAQKPVPADHGYLLYAAISRELPHVHRENGVAIHPIRGQLVGDRMLGLTPSSVILLRVPDGQIADFLPLAGRSIRLGETAVRVGAPQVRPLTLAPALRSRLVVIKIKDLDAAALTPENFLTAARKQLDALSVSPQAITTIGKRRTLQIKQREIVGYELIVEGLTAEESLTLQEKGLGGRRHMGCGVFVPLR